MTVSFVSFNLHMSMPKSFVLEVLVFLKRFSCSLYVPMASSGELKPYLLLVHEVLLAASKKANAMHKMSKWDFIHVRYFFIDSKCIFIIILIFCEFWRKINKKFDIFILWVSINWYLVLKILKIEPKEMLRWYVLLVYVNNCVNICGLGK